MENIMAINIWVNFEIYEIVFQKINQNLLLICMHVGPLWVHNCLNRISIQKRQTSWKIEKKLKSKLKHFSWLTVNFPIKKIPYDLPYLPQTFLMPNTANLTPTIRAFQIKNLIMLESHLKTSNIFSGVFGMELKWKVLHVLADQGLNVTCLGLGQNVKRWRHFNDEVFVVLG